MFKSGRDDRYSRKEDNEWSSRNNPRRRVKIGTRIIEGSAARGGLMSRVKSGDMKEKSGFKSWNDMINR